MIDESLETPDKVRELQIKLYRKAKSEPDYRFYLLYDIDSSGGRPATGMAMGKSQ